MNLSIGNILAFLMILFAMNGIATGLGVVDQSNTNSFNIFGSDTTIDNLDDKYKSGDLATVGTVYDDVNPEDDTATVDFSIISGVPFTQDITDQTTYFWDILKGIVLGYAFLIYLLPIGTAAQWILIGLIGFAQFGSIIYLLLYAFSIIRGGGGIWCHW